MSKAFIKWCLPLLFFCIPLLGHAFNLQYVENNQHLVIYNHTPRVTGYYDTNTISVIKCTPSQYTIHFQIYVVNRETKEIWMVDKTCLYDIQKKMIQVHNSHIDAFSFDGHHLFSGPVHDDLNGYLEPYSIGWDMANMVFKHICGLPFDEFNRRQPPSYS